MKKIKETFPILVISFAINIFLFVGVIITGNMRLGSTSWLDYLFVGLIIASWFVGVIVSVIFCVYNKKKQDNNGNLLQKMLLIDGMHLGCMIVIFPIVFGGWIFLFDLVSIFRC